jgi:hypothetical protein
VTTSALCVLTVLALSVAVIIGTLVGAAAALLAIHDGATTVTALLRAAVAFGATLSLIALLVTTVAGLLP